MTGLAIGSKGYNLSRMNSQSSYVGWPMVVAHRSLGGHTGGCGGRGYGRARSDELLTCTSDRLGDRGSAGKASTPVEDDERAKANTASWQQVAPRFAPVANDRPVNISIRSRLDSMVDRI